MRGRQPDLARMTITQKPAAMAQPRRRQDRPPTTSGAMSAEPVPAQGPAAQSVNSHAVSPEVPLRIGEEVDFCI